MTQSEMTNNKEIDNSIKQNQPNLTQYNTNYHPKPIELNEEQKTKLNMLKESIEKQNLKEQHEFHSANHFTDSSLLRYLRANKWSLDNALQGLTNTLNWRKEFRPDLLKPSQFLVEGATGKIYCNGYDKENHPIVYMDPSKQNTNDSKAHIQFTVFCLELALKMLPNDVEKLSIVIDLRTYGLKHAVPLSESKEVLTILSSHYPERLGRAFILDAPWVFSSFFKLISPLIDPVTRDKIRFCNSKKQDENHLSNFIEKDQLSEELGGASTYVYNSEAYFEKVHNTFF